MRISPKFTHDCDHCTFLGRLGGQDAYVCSEGTETLILRHSDDDPDYRSFSAEYIHLLPPTDDFHIVKRMME